MYIKGFATLMVVLSLLSCSQAPVTETENLQEQNNGIRLEYNPDYTAVTASVNAKAVFVDDSVDSGWAVAEAVEIWNDAIGCEYFYITETPTSNMVAIFQYSADDEFLGYHERGVIFLNIYDAGPGFWNGPQPSTTIHELGHELGIGHTYDPRDVMYGVEEAGDVQTYLPTELTANDLHELATTGYTYCEG